MCREMYKADEGRQSFSTTKLKKAPNDGTSFLSFT
jgi:hypothetical protein